MVVVPLNISILSKIFLQLITFIYRFKKKEYLLLSWERRKLKLIKQTQTELPKQVQYEDRHKNIIK